MGFDCSNIPWGKVRETILAYVAGIVFSFAWWLWIDATAWSNCCTDDIAERVKWWHWFPNVVTFVCFVSINVISWIILEENVLMTSNESKWPVRIWLYASFVGTFLMLVAALWIAIQVFWVDNNPDSGYCGAALFISNGLLLLSCVFYRMAVSWDKNPEGGDNGL
eukprot:TRINITY_DN10897_c0_g1_i1.p1 TRINITY_DN10897_c0_g1~~TRINITY_DN10897_c0_g1_i1.p1  ORF type:complete len:165 (+),score=23.06 TRINITY_DN10897_c0_g1_i1:99-593(+)